jgi:PemK-like, MazF-like toxin of type II toxin-antitoxin system
MARGGLRNRLTAALSRLVRRPATGPRPATRPGSATVAGPRSVADEIGYAPRPDGLPDPGEIVWGWVPYDEGDGRGKDRPVLVIGRRGPDLLGLQLTSKDHHRDAEDEARWGRYWADLGTGDWDARHRQSEVRLDKLLVLDPAQVRREGAALDRARFDRVIAEARRVQGW